MDPDAAFEKVPVLEFSEFVGDSAPRKTPLSFVLHKGEFGFVRRRSVALSVLGMRKPLTGEVKVEGRAWSCRSDAGTENVRRRIGIVHDPRSEITAEWISNLDVDENIALGAQFDGRRTERSIEEKMQMLADELGMSHGVPVMRPAMTSAADLLLSQWMRALMPEPLDLLVLENPIVDLNEKSTERLSSVLKRNLKQGVAILWVAEQKPNFETFGLIPDVDV